MSKLKSRAQTAIERDAKSGRNPALEELQVHLAHLMGPIVAPVAEAMVVR